MMPCSKKKILFLPQAFTLVEMLLVIVIISILLALGAMAFQGSLQSQNLRATARQLAADLDFATLLARKENRPVDVFFYSYKDLLGNSEAIRAYQYGVLQGFSDDNKPEYRFLVEAKRLPEGMVVSPKKEFTTLLNLPVRGALPNPGSGVPEEHTFYSYQIRPDGTTTLDRDVKHTLTLYWDKDSDSSSLPPDFRTVTVDAATSRARVY